jgi:hypothetical protein
VETLVSLATLAALAAIAAAILVKQAHYDRAVINPGLVVAEKSQSAGSGGLSAGTASAEAAPPPSEAETATDLAVQKAAAAGTLAASDASAAPQILAQITLPSGVKAVAAPEAFDATTLSDKIDGRAEFYLDIGFEHLETRRYEIASEPACAFEAFLYRMSSPIAAFAAWSGQRRPDARPEKDLPLAYSTANAFYLARGPYYVELVSASETFGARPEVREFARTLSEKLLDNEPETDIVALLPEEGRVAGSERLILKDAFGFARLDKVILADYLVENTTVSLFISPRITEAEARELARAYHAFLVQEMGADDVSHQLGGLADASAANSLGEYEVIQPCGKNLVGIHAAKRLDVAMRLLTRTCRKP